MATLSPAITIQGSKRGGFLIGPIADSVLLIASPLLALALTATLHDVVPDERLTTALSVLIAAHLVVTFVHTHGNAAIFAKHRVRFTVVPVLLFAALALSPAARAIAIVVAVVWDVHHSGMQTFGLARIYARKAGNTGGEGRTLDLVLNHVLYAGPLLAGAGLLLHLQRMGPLARDWGVLDASLDEPWMQAARATLVVAGLVAIAAHVVGHVRLARRGVPVSPQAVALLASTGVASLASWGFNSFGLAFFTMKLFHCLQYFTLVAVAERSQVSEWFGARERRLSLPLVGLVLLVPALAYGAWTQSAFRDVGGGAATALVLSVTLLHFWYDGFTWSATPKEAR